MGYFDDIVNPNGSDPVQKPVQQQAKSKYFDDIINDPKAAPATQEQSNLPTDGLTPDSNVAKDLALSAGKGAIGLATSLPKLGLLIADTVANAGTEAAKIITSPLGDVDKVQAIPSPSQKVSNIFDTAGKAADALGIPKDARPTQWEGVLDRNISTETKLAEANAQREADLAEEQAKAEGKGILGQMIAGASGQLKGYKENPVAALMGIAENAPQFIGNAAITRSLMKNTLRETAEKVAAGTLTKEAADALITKHAATISSLVEGGITAGQVEGQISEENPNATLGDRLLSIPAGVLSATISKATGLIPGLENVEGKIAANAVTQPTRSRLASGALGALTEGVLQEPFQEGQEQIWKNLGTGKEWQSGVGASAVQGAVVGGPMGAAGGAITGGKTKEQADQNVISGTIDKIKGAGLSAHELVALRESPTALQRIGITPEHIDGILSEQDPDRVEVARFEHVLNNAPSDAAKQGLLASSRGQAYTKLAESFKPAQEESPKELDLDSAIVQVASRRADLANRVDLTDEEASELKKLNKVDYTDPGSVAKALGITIKTSGQKTTEPESLFDEKALSDATDAVRGLDVFKQRENLLDLWHDLQTVPVTERNDQYTTDVASLEADITSLNEQLKTTPEYNSWQSLFNEAKAKVNTNPSAPTPEVKPASTPTDTPAVKPAGKPAQAPASIPKQAPAKPPAKPKAVEPVVEPETVTEDTTGLVSGFKDLGGAISETFYNSVLEALNGKDNAISRANDPVLLRSKKAFDLGLIKSTEDIKLAEAIFDKEGADGLAKHYNDLASQRSTEPEVKEPTDGQVQADTDKAEPVDSAGTTAIVPEGSTAPQAETPPPVSAAALRGKATKRKNLLSAKIKVGTATDIEVEEHKALIDIGNDVKKIEEHFSKPAENKALPKVEDTTKAIQKAEENKAQDQVKVGSITTRSLLARASNRRKSLRDKIDAKKATTEERAELAKLEEGGEDLDVLASHFNVTISDKKEKKVTAKETTKKLKEATKDKPSKEQEAERIAAAETAQQNRAKEQEAKDLESIPKEHHAKYKELSAKEADYKKKMISAGRREDLVMANTYQALAKQAKAEKDSLKSVQTTIYTNETEASRVDQANSKSVQNENVHSEKNSVQVLTDIQNNVAVNGDQNFNNDPEPKLPGNIKASKASVLGELKQAYKRIQANPDNIIFGTTWYDSTIRVFEHLGWWLDRTHNTEVVANIPPFNKAKSLEDLNSILEEYGKAFLKDYKNHVVKLDPEKLTEADQQLAGIQGMDLYHVAGIINNQRADFIKGIKDYLDASPDLYNTFFKADVISQYIRNNYFYDADAGVAKSFKITPRTLTATSLFSGAIASSYLYETDTLEKAIQKVYQKSEDVYTRNDVPTDGWFKFEQNSNPERLGEIAATCPAQWCTGRGAAKTHIQGGDFYIFSEGGEARIAIRMDGDEDIGEISGSLPGQHLAPDEIDTVLKFVKEKGWDAKVVHNIADDQATVRALQEWVASDGKAPITWPISVTLKNGVQLEGPRRKHVRYNANLPLLVGAEQEKFNQLFDQTKKDLVETDPNDHRHYIIKGQVSSVVSESLYKVTLPDATYLAELKLKNDNSLNAPYVRKIDNFKVSNSVSISLPGLEEVGNLESNNNLKLPALTKAKDIQHAAGELIVDKLVSVNSINVQPVYASAKVSAASLETAKSLYIHGTFKVPDRKHQAALYAPKLTQAKDIHVRQAKNEVVVQAFPSLIKLDNIYAEANSTVSIPLVTKLNNISINRSQIEAPKLETVGDLTIQHGSGREKIGKHSYPSLVNVTERLVIGGYNSVEAQNLKNVEVLTVAPGQKLPYSNFLTAPNVNINKVVDISNPEVDHLFRESIGVGTSTVDQIESALEVEFGKGDWVKLKNLGEAKQSGGIVIRQTLSEALEFLGTPVEDLEYLSLDGEGIQGLHNTDTGLSVIVADNTSAENAKGVLIHEVGVHGAENSKLDEQALNLLEQHKNSKFMLNVLSKLADAGLLDDSGNITDINELRAYIVEEAVNTSGHTELDSKFWKWANWHLPKGVVSFLRNFVTSVKQAFIDLGLLAPEKLNVQDLVNIARSQVTRAANQSNQGVKASFAGPIANLTEEVKQKLMEAKSFKEMMTPSEVLGLTGWWEFTEDQWVYEIDDARSHISTELRTDMVNSDFNSVHKGTVNDVYIHEALFKAYPFLKEIPITVNQTEEALSRGPSGSYHPMGKKYPKGDIIISVADHYQVKQVLLHELQHAIQDYEFWQDGSSPNSQAIHDTFHAVQVQRAYDVLDYVTTLYGQEQASAVSKAFSQANDISNENFHNAVDIAVSHVLADPIHPAQAQQYKTRLNRTPPTKYELYTRVSGEVMARLVEYRLNLDNRDMSPHDALNNMLVEEGLLQPGNSVQSLLINTKDFGKEVSYSIKSWKENEDGILTPDGRAHTVEGIESLRSASLKASKKKKGPLSVDEQAIKVLEKIYHAKGKSLDKAIQESALDLAERSTNPVAKWFYNLTHTLHKPFTRDQYTQSSNWWDRVVSSPEFYMYNKAPATREMVNAAIDDSDVRYQAQKRILGNFLTIANRIAKKHPGLYEAAKKYLLDTDKTGIGFKLRKQDDEWVVLNRKDEEVFKSADEKKAETAMINAEQQWLRSRATAEPVLTLVKEARLLTNRAFDVLAEDMRKQIERAAEAGIPEPKASLVNDEGKVEEVSLSELIAQMGDLRGTYFPRERVSRAFKLVAEQDGLPSISETFDWIIPENKLGDYKAEMLKKTFNALTPAGARIRELIKLGYKAENIRTDAVKTPTDMLFDLPGTLATLDSLLTEASDKVKEEDMEAYDKKLLEQANKALSLRIADIYKAKGTMSSRLARAEKYYEGFETDPIRALTGYANRISTGVAKRITARRMIMAFTGRMLTFKQFQAKFGTDKTYSQYLHWVKLNKIHPSKQKKLYEDGRQYMQYFLSPASHAEQLIGYVKAAAVFKYLGFRVGSAAFNATSMVISVPATIAAHTGASLIQVSKSIARATRVFAAYKHNMLLAKAQNSDNMMAGLYKSLGRPMNISEDDFRIMDTIYNNGWAVAQFNHEAAEAMKGAIGTWANDVMAAGMYMFGKVEEMNRALTIFATYDTIRQNKLKRNGKVIDNLSTGQILNLAKHASDRAHGIYGKAAKPWIIQKVRALDAMYTFQKYQHSYHLNMIELFNKYKSPKAVAFLMLMPQLVAGTSTLSAIGMLVASALGVDDPQESYESLMSKILGKGKLITELIHNGVLGAIAGINTKGSMETKIPIPNDLTELFGAPQAVFMDIFEGIGHLEHREYSKALEKMLPSAFGSPLKGYREKTEGVTKKNYAPMFIDGQRIYGDNVDFVKRLLSFNPTRISDLRGREWREEEVRRAYKDRRNSIVEEYNRLLIQDTNPIDPRWASFWKTVDHYNQRAAVTPHKYQIPQVTFKFLLDNQKRNFKPTKVTRFSEDTE